MAKFPICTKVGPLQAFKPKRIVVRFHAKDWLDLVNFIHGDLVNMPEDNEVRVQMQRLSDEIRARCVKV